MAKKNNTQKYNINSSKNRIEPNENKKLGKTYKDTDVSKTQKIIFNSSLLLSIVSCICIAFSIYLFLKPCLENELTNWDDAGYLLNNNLIRDLSFDGIKNIFSKPIMGNYHPITILSYALEYNWFGMQPYQYHLDNLLLHILNALLVYWFLHLLCKNNMVALIASFLFGLHPMLVETVAWVADRKDLLYVLFYVSSCIIWLFYIRLGNKNGYWQYLFVLLFALFSLLSKPVAVTLPFSLLLIDYFEGRKINWELVLEKSPLFILSLVFGIIAIKIQKDTGAINSTNISYSFLERIALGSFAFAIYVYKLIFPLGLHCFYPYPAKINNVLPYLFYVYPLGIILFFGVIWRFFRFNKIVVFGISFFVTNIVLLIQLVPVGDAIVAERYTYLSCIGVFYLISCFIYFLYNRLTKITYKYIMILFVVMYIYVLGYQSNLRCRDWHDSVSLWTSEIKEESINAPIAYNNLAYGYFTKYSDINTNKEEKKIDLDSAFISMKQSVALTPYFVNSIRGLGMLYFAHKDFDSALFYFKRVIDLKPTAEAYGDYGKVLDMKGFEDSALIEYNLSIEMNPNLYPQYFNRSQILKRKNRYEEAEKDLNKAIELKPEISELYYARSYCYAKKGDKKNAAKDIEKAKSLGFTKIDTTYYRIMKTQ